MEERERCGCCFSLFYPWRRQQQEMEYEKPISPSLPNSSNSPTHNPSSSFATLLTLNLPPPAVSKKGAVTQQKFACEYACFSCHPSVTVTRAKGMRIRRRVFFLFPCTGLGDERKLHANCRVLLAILCALAVSPQSLSPVHLEEHLQRICMLMWPSPPPWGGGRGTRSWEHRMRNHIFRFFFIFPGAIFACVSCPFLLVKRSSERYRMRSSPGGRAEEQRDPGI